MSEVRFADVLADAATRIGLDADDLQREQAKALARYIQERCEEALETYDWPQARLTEARKYAPDYDADDASELVAGDVVFYAADGVSYWRAKVDGPVAVPGADDSEWESADADVERVFALKEAGMTPMSAVLEVRAEDPRQNRDARCVYFFTAGDVVYVPGGPDVVWVVFNAPPPRFSAVPWRAAESYAAGDVVLHGGDCWLCESANQGQEPPVSGTVTRWWRKQVFPGWLRRFASRAAAADWLDEDERPVEEVERLERKAYRALEQEMERAVWKLGARGRLKVASR